MLLLVTPHALLLVYLVVRFHLLCLENVQGRLRFRLLVLEIPTAASRNPLWSVIVS